MKNSKIKLLLIGFLLLHPVSSNSKVLPPKPPSDPFYRAVYRGKLEKVESFLKKGVSQEKKNTALGKVNINNEKTFNLLIKYGADVNSKDKEGNTPLHLKRNSKGIVKLLIENGADVNVKNNEGNTPLHLLKLSKISCSPFIKDKEYFDFYWNGSAKLLIDNGADVNARNNKSETPLFYVKDLEFAKLLIKYGADVNARNNDGETPLFYVKGLAFAKLLIENGADISFWKKLKFKFLYIFINFLNYILDCI